MDRADYRSENEEGQEFSLSNVGPCWLLDNQPTLKPRAVTTPSPRAQGPGISMELSRDSSYDEVCAALAERLRAEGQAEALQLEDPQQLRFTGQQSWTATIPKTAPFKWRQWDALHQVPPLLLW